MKLMIENQALRFFTPIPSTLEVSQDAEDPTKINMNFFVSPTRPYRIVPRGTLNMKNLIRRNQYIGPDRQLTAGE